MGSTLAAWTFAAEGKRVGVIERRYIGDRARTSRACRARISSTARRSHSTFAEARNFGIHDAGFQIDMAGVRDRKRTMVAGLNRICLDNY
jgi:hypothetical protein